MPAPPLVVQTTYAELLERCTKAAFDDAFIEEGAFTSKAIKGRRYWYFQTGIGRKRTQLYVGPETPELLERIAHHRETRDDTRERRSLVSTLVRSFNLPRPNPEIGEIIEALAQAGIFRLRGVLSAQLRIRPIPRCLASVCPPLHCRRAISISPSSEMCRSQSGTVPL